ncbi:Zinc finger C4H2 domain-containing protein [Lunasporangiospora selenospora]|uniref:Zinc finger C4H2 domain-containing protein n=1 Tax=Lunasporangiospora selenospora TaxID=979761 RepID=A0A9P6G2G7_9FUNG|nr:Zinc finger C4H2 domain-containing protein [Lunasporangiospora selenospora]
MLDSSQEEQPILSEPEEPSMSLNRLSKIDTTTNQYIPHITSTSLHSQESQESKQPLESQSDSEQRSTYNFEDKDNKEQARLPSESKSTSATASTPARSPLIVRLRIPASHRSQFAEVLKNPPYPRLGSKKKFVHFDTAPTSQKSASPSTKRRVSEEQADEGFSSSTSKQARHSTGMSSEQRTPSPSSAYSSGLSLSRSSSSSSLPPTFDKDPEEKMAELKELKKLKNRQEDLVHVKDQIIQATQLLEDKESVVDEVRGERKALQSELSKYIGMVVQIRKDLDLVLTAEKDLSKERDQLSQHLTRLRELDYNNLKEEVDQLRAKCGLKSLPSLEQEQEEIMSKYLEQRRGQWREDGFLQDAGLGVAPEERINLLREVATVQAATILRIVDMAPTAAVGVGVKVLPHAHLQMLVRSE